MQPQTPTETGWAQAEHAVTLTSMSFTKNTQRRRRCIKHRGRRPDTDQVRANLPKPFKHPLQKTPSCRFVHSVSHSKLNLTQKHIHLWESTHLGLLCNRIGDSSDQCETIPVTLMTYYPFHFNPDNRKHVGGKQCAAWVEAKRTNENGNQEEPGGSEGARHWRQFILQNESRAELWLVFPERYSPSTPLFTQLKFYWTLATCTETVLAKYLLCIAIYFYLWFLFLNINLKTGFGRHLSSDLIWSIEV